MKKNTFSFFFLFSLFACNDGLRESGETKNVAKTTEIISQKKVADIEPRLAVADSVQVIYYDDPDGDSLRYTRYFTLTETADTGQVKKLLNEMDQVYVQEPKMRPCRSEGKLYLLKGEEVLKTVYFSARGDTCRYFYFIRDGVFVYVPVTRMAEEWLKESRRTSRKPGK